MTFAIKAALSRAERLHFGGHKTMYGGKRIAKGDLIFLFASGAEGLIARGQIETARQLPKPVDVERWTPRVDLTVSILAYPRFR